MADCNVFRDGAVHVQARLCDTCIFRPGNKMGLHEGRVESMVEECIENQGVIPCHETIHRGVDNNVCRGFFDRYKHDVQMLSIAERLGCMVEVAVE